MIQIIHRRHNDLVTLENVFTLLIRVCRTHKNALEQYDIIILLASYLLFFRLKKQSNSFVYLPTAFYNKPRDMCRDVWIDVVFCSGKERNSNELGRELYVLVISLNLIFLNYVNILVLFSIRSNFDIIFCKAKFFVFKRRVFCCRVWIVRLFLRWSNLFLSSCLRNEAIRGIESSSAEESCKKHYNIFNYFTVETQVMD